jgi:hypothetical protein
MRPGEVHVGELNGVATSIEKKGTRHRVSMDVDALTPLV